MYERCLDFLLPAEAGDPITSTILARQLDLSGSLYRKQLGDILTKCASTDADINEQVDRSARMLAGAQEKLLDRYDSIFEFFQHVSICHCRFRKQTVSYIKMILMSTSTIKTSHASSLLALRWRMLHVDFCSCCHSVTSLGLDGWWAAKLQEA